MAAILAAPNDEAREKIANLPPLSTWLFFLLTAAVVSLVIAVAVRLEHRFANRARDCQTDKDCDPPQKCRQHACTDIAERPIALYYEVRTSPVGRIYGH